MDLRIKGKTAVVTASSKGLGKAVAQALAAEGVNLAICSREELAINETAEQLMEKYKVKVLPIVCDVTSEKDIIAFKNNVEEYFGSCHILFANAGGPPPGTILAVSTEQVREALELNLVSTINLVNAFLPFMKREHWGRILASTSITVKQPIPNLALSNISRVGVVAYIKTLAIDIAPLDITANTIAPGYIMTERVKKLLTDQAERDGITYNEVLQKLMESIPIKRIAKPAEFGALCAFLASESASYITGETILIDGGLNKGLM